MTDVASTREQAARNFRDHLNHLLARTLTQTPLVQFLAPNRHMNVAFRRGGVPHRAELATRLPTGYVTLEEIIRFCIVDLAAAPLSDNWNEVLDESYRLFKDGFVSAPPAEPSGKKYRPRPKRARRR